MPCNRHPKNKLLFELRRFCLFPVTGVVLMHCDLLTIIPNVYSVPKISNIILGK